MAEKTLKGSIGADPERLPVEDSELSLQLGSRWLAGKRAEDPAGYLQRAWEVYAQDREAVVESALLSYLGGRLRFLALELRAEVPAAARLDPQDLLRSGLMAMQLSLARSPHAQWQRAEEDALDLGVEAMRRRVERPR